MEADLNYILSCNPKLLEPYRTNPHVRKGLDLSKNNGIAIGQSLIETIIILSEINENCMNEITKLQQEKSIRDNQIDYYDRPI